MVSKILYLRMKKAVKRLNRSLDEKKRLIRIYKRRTADLRRRLAKVSREKAVLEDGYVVEWCLHCERQVVMLWDVKEDGMVAYCPYCSQRMMLCEKCAGDCDYDYGKDICKEM